jgi:hypothetical protein
MSTSAIIMMVIAIAVLWGGLALAIRNVARNPENGTGAAERDL